jgi:8-oxo-dGTP pyrophosphatase MutT (NUDIX family)
MHRNELLNMLTNYHSRFMEEEAFVRRSIEFVNQHEKIFDRETPVHVTGSAWVVSPDREQVLLMHHRKLNQWFQPGGHADGDADILRVALRECAEETGLEPSHIRLIDSSIFDVDIHTTPAMGNTPPHEHIDIRFVVEVDDWLPIPGNDESHAVEWFPLHQVLRYNNNRSTYRMLEKTRGMRNFHRTIPAQERLAAKVQW